MRRNLWVIALAALLVLDVALVAWALSPGTPSTDVTQDVASTTSSAPASSPVSSSQAAGSSDRTIVVSLGSTRAMRVISGSDCKGEVRVSASQDAGRSWTDGPKVPLRMVSSATSNAVGLPVLIGLDGSCKPSAVQIDGTDVRSVNIDVTWAINPADRSTLLSQGRPTVKACASGAVLDMAWDTTRRANVLCDAGVIRRTTNGGATWSDLGSAKGATGIATAADAELYVASDQSCGVGIATLAASTGSAECVEGSAGMKGADITIVGSTTWVADSQKGFVVPTIATTSEQETAQAAPRSTAPAATEAGPQTSATPESPAGDQAAAQPQDTVPAGPRTSAARPAYTPPAYTPPAYTPPAYTPPAYTPPAYTPPARTPEASTATAPDTSVTTDASPTDGTAVPDSGATATDRTP